MILAQLDESVPRQLARALEAHGIQARPFPESWKGLSNGHLLDRIEAEGVHVFITCDGHMSSQQSLAKRSFAVVTIPTNRRRIVIANVAGIADLARHAAPGSHSVVNVGAS
jgi:hypothetical protein